MNRGSSHATDYEVIIVVIMMTAAVSAPVRTSSEATAEVWIVHL